MLNRKFTYKIAPTLPFFDKRKGYFFLSYFIKFICTFWDQKCFAKKFSVFLEIREQKNTPLLYEVLNNTRNKNYFIGGKGYLVFPHYTFVLVLCLTLL